MIKSELNKTICLKKYIFQSEYEEINKLEALILSKDKISLKLELDYKLNICKNSEIGSEDINEFLYYIDGILVAYLGISSFNRNIGEINGMTHPDYRRKGLFKELFELALKECTKRKFNKLLLLSDGKSDSGIEFIKSVHGNYDFSEYRMKLINMPSFENKSPVNLRFAEITDKKEIARQDSLYWGFEEEIEVSEENEESPNQFTYMIQLKEETIGKINVEYDDNFVYIFGFGILPNFRGQGYGKAALKQTLHLLNKKNVSNIELDVECKNSTALNLYKDCGFEEKSVMNYYKINS